MVLAHLSRRFASVTWEEGHELGRGSFGVCYAGTLKGRTGRHADTSWPEMEVAVKVLDPHRTPDADKFMREVEVMANAHRALLGLVAWGHRSGCFCLVTRRMRTDLSYLLKGTLSLPAWNATTKSITALGIAAGMAHLHSRGIIHRDLKPENVLMSEDCRPRVADFGLARSIPLSEQLEMTKDVGTPLYMAPELITGDDYGLPVDVYAWAFIFWQLISGEQVFVDIPMAKNPLAVMNYVVAGGRPKLSVVQDSAHNELLQKCWNQSPSLRLTFAEILQQADKLMIAGCDVGEFNAYRDQMLNPT
jgi:serine/threonine protein kinase